MKMKLALLSVVTTLPLMAADNEIGFVEKFALAKDRAAVLGQLIPGSEDYYYYRALQAQNAGQVPELKNILDQWARRFPHSERREVIENRAALLGYERDPAGTLEYLRQKLNPELDHEQAARDRKPDLPSALDPASIARSVFQAEGLQEDDLHAFNDEALETLVREKAVLRPAQARALLTRLKRPDVPGLVDVIDSALRATESHGFGEFPIHRLLLPEQLDELARRLPALRTNQSFIFTRLRQLAPGADTDPAFDPAEREQWLERLWAPVEKLPPAFNTLKAQILFQRLQLDRTRGIYDKARFIAYLKLPRRTAYATPRYSEQPELARYPVDQNANFSGELPGLLPIGNDDWLVRDYLLRLLAEEPSWQPWIEWLRDTYVQPIFAEAKIVNGVGDPEQWASLLTPESFQALKDRVDVDFSAANPPFLNPSDDVSLDLTLKNTPKLIVKLYEVNTLSFFLTQKRQLNTDLNLDGLVANHEVTHDYAAEEGGQNPFRRVPRIFDFPELKDRRGAWVVEFIGGGKSSSALIRKGQWQVLQQIGPAGDMLTVLDEKFVPVKDAVAWVDGRKLTPDEKTGFIVVPFTNQPGDKPVILADAAGTFATLTEFEHHAESYRLDAQFHIEREQLLGRRNATLAVRTALLLGDTPVALGLLQEVKLTLTTHTLDGLATTKEIKDVKLDAAVVFTHTFPVPERTAEVEVTLSARVENLGEGGTKQDLTATHSFSINGIDRSAKVATGLLSKLDGKFVFELLGKNGEPEADQVVSFTLKHHDFTETVDASLSTDAKGRIQLGTLAGIEEINATLPNELSRSWTLDPDGTLRPGELHARAGDTLLLPWIATGAKLSPNQVSLLEKRGDAFVKDRFSALALKDGFLEIKGLPPGDYALRLREEEHDINLRITAGTPVRNWLVSPHRHLEIRNARPVQISSVKTEAETLVVQLRNVTPATRLHLAAVRFVTDDWQLSDLSQFSRLDPGFEQPARRPNLFVAGRAIGDEYRYILERRYAKTYPGNMLTRPGLLLNPWDVRATELEALSAARGGAQQGSWDGLNRRAKMAAPSEEMKSVVENGGAAEGAPNLDFLATAAPVFYNLVPDAAGVVRLDRKALGDRQYIQLYAEDLTSAVWRTVSLPEVPTKFQDLRLSRGLDPAKPFAERKQVTTLLTGQSLTLADVLTSELETYDSIASVYNLFNAVSELKVSDSHEIKGLSDDVPTYFAKFAFILEWPRLKDEEKRAKYSEFACHELNFFLSRKDPVFFQAVIQPYLRNKKDKTFLDDDLIGADLKRYLEPWAYGQLNVVERCLLSRRIDGEAPTTARHLRELWELLPPNPDEDRLFETALRGRALSDAEQGSFSAARDEAERSPSMPGLEVAAPASPAAVAAPKAMRRSFDMAESAAGSPSEAAMKKPMAIMSDAIPEQPIDKDLELQDTLRMRSEIRQYFRELGPTKEWAENNYYRRPIAEQNAGLVTINAFWRDYAAWDGKSPFLSEHVTEASHSFTEMMLALAVLDLPFEAAKPTTKADGGSFTLTAASPLLTFHKQIKVSDAAAPEEAGGPELLVSENFFRADDRYREEGNEKFDKYVTEEFIAGVVYGANVVVTNPRSSPQKLELLLQIPQGALAASGSKATDSRRLRLQPFTTQTFEYFFYFPAPAAKSFTHYPVHVSRNEHAAGAAQPFSFKVVKQLTAMDKTTWEYVSQSGTDAELFAFLEKNNLARLDLEAIAWRARKSAEFFRKITAFLAQHHLWSEPIYRYGLVHKDPGALHEWLRHEDGFVAQCGPWLNSKLLVIDPVERRTYEHLEYSPLVNQRAHRLGAENKIPNPVLLAQYQHLLTILAHKPTLDAADEMSVVYYLFLQDRVEEALARFHTIKPEALPTRLQYDYFHCVAAFYEEQTGEARQVASAYADYPVDRWRQLFAEVTAQLDEIEGKAVTRPGSDQPERERQQAALAAGEPSFDLKVENRSIALTWRNLGAVTVNYYLMDPEFLFSASPFVTQDAGRFSIIKPTQSTPLTLPAGKTTLEVPLPEAFAKKNVLVEILGAGQRKAQPYHANTLDLALTENYGRLELRDTLASKPVSKAYVKVYARLKNGTVRFFKDGYTDLRGKFDYASLNSSANSAAPRPMPLERGGGATGLDYQMLTPGELNDVERFSLLVLSDDHGAVVREVNPPTQ